MVDLPFAMPDTKLPLRDVLTFAAPAVGLGYMYLLVALYVMKYSTDVLLIAPAVMGIIFSASRILDAVSDPLVGYLSDRTRSRFGRRRVWMLGSVIPTFAFFYMVFSQPAGLSGVALGGWMAVAIIGFYIAITLFFIPHLSLGAELAAGYHDRSRLYGYRHSAYTIGSILALYSMQVFLTAEQGGKVLVQASVGYYAILAGVVFTLLVLYAVTRLPEKTQKNARSAKSAFATIAEVWRNPHARLLLVVTFVEHIGSAAIGVLTLYIAQYILGRPLMAVVIILFYMVPSAFSVPLWIPLSRRIGKIRLWTYSMLLTGFSFGCMFFLIYLEGNTQLYLIFLLAFTAGLAAGCGGTIGPSVQSDVIDYDELLTGERKEGAYFAAWNFVYKSAYGVMLLLTGFALQASGFVPNAEQSEVVKYTMLSLYGLLPLLCYVIGAWLFQRFELDESAHMNIRRDMSAREKVSDE